MKELLFVCVLLHIQNSFCLKVIVSGWLNSKIATYNVDGSSLSPSTVWDVGEAGKSMTWLQMDGEHIYAGHEVFKYQGQLNSVVSRWVVKDDGSSLERLEYVSTGTIQTAHITVDKNQSKVYAVGAGTLSIINLKADGSLDTGTPAREVTYGTADASLALGCREPSFPTQTVTRGSWVWVVDFGCDRVWHYSLGEDGQLESTGQTLVQPVEGPRHIVMHPTRDLMFIICEMQKFVLVYRKVSKITHIFNTFIYYIFTLFPLKF